MPPMSTTRMRLERLGDERARLYEKIEETVKLAEDEQRDPNELERQHLTNWRTRTEELEEEINALAGDLERAESGLDVSKRLRTKPDEPDEGDGAGAHHYRTFAAYARDVLITRYPIIASNAAGDPTREIVVREGAMERLQRVQNTLTSDVQGLLPPQYITEIMDLINSSRPVVASGRAVPLDRGKLTYFQIAQRPQVAKQSGEKTEAGTAKMIVNPATLQADTFLGGGDLSWQAINWSTPDALQLWFDLAAEAYAQQTEFAACSELGTAGGGTITTPLGTTGTESFAQWRAAAIAAIASIYTATGGRAKTNALYLSAQRFFALAGLGTDQVIQVSPVGNLDIGSMTGTWAGMKVIGSYGFTNPNAAVVGDSTAFLVGETQGAPVELKAVEPAIGGMEVGVIGAFKAKVFDPNRFMHLS